MLWACLVFLTPTTFGKKAAFLWGSKAWHLTTTTIHHRLLCSASLSMIQEVQHQTPAAEELLYEKKPIFFPVVECLTTVCWFVEYINVEVNGESRHLALERTNRQPSIFYVSKQPLSLILISASSFEMTKDQMKKGRHFLYQSLFNLFFITYFYLIIFITIIFLLFCITSVFFRV